MTAERNIPLDILRGIAILDMMFVDTAGIFPNMYDIFLHSNWEGITIADLAFPGFVFAMGASAFFSQKIAGKRLKNNFLWFKKIFKRTVILFLLGVAFNIFPMFLNYLINSTQNFTAFFNELLNNFRILGVLQRLALVYFFASIILRIFRGKYLLTIAFALLLISSISYRIYSFDFPFLKENNLSIFIDLYLFTANHIYISNPPLEPEGVLGVIASISSMLFGVYAMKLTVEENYKKLIFFGTSAIFLGGVWSVFDIICKSLWSAPYALITTGFFTYLLLFVSILWNQLKEKNKIFTPFLAFGRNPIFFYFITNFALIFLNTIYLENGDTLFIRLYHLTFQGILSDAFSATLFTFVWCVLWYPLAKFLYKEDIKIKC